jgi:hypothetical protein
MVSSQRRLLQPSYSQRPAAFPHSLILTRSGTLASDIGDPFRRRFATANKQKALASKARARCALSVPYRPLRTGLKAASATVTEQATALIVYLSIPNTTGRSCVLTLAETTACDRSRSHCSGSCNRHQGSHERGTRSEWWAVQDLNLRVPLRSEDGRVTALPTVRRRRSGFDR